MVEHDKTMGKELRVEMRLRNNRLWNLIHPRWDSVSAFCRDLALNQRVVGELLNLKLYPISKKGGDYRSVCQKIALHFKTLPEDIFPLEIYALEKTEGSAEIGPEQIPFYECALLPAPDVIDPLIEGMANTQLIEKLLLLVTPRERLFLEMKYGLGEHDPHTHEEIGREAGIEGARVQQIVEKAIRRIQFSPKAKKLFSSFASDGVSDLLKLEDEIRSVREYIDALEQAVSQACDRRRAEFPESARILELWFGLNGYEPKSAGEICLLLNKPAYYAGFRREIDEELFVVSCDHDVQSVLRRNDAECIMRVACSYASLETYKPKIQSMFWKYHR